MTITRDIIRVFYHTIMAVCSTVYIHLYWGSQKTESIILGSCFCWNHLQLGNSHIISMIPGSGHSLYPVLAPESSFWKGLRVMTYEYVYCLLLLHNQLISRLVPNLKILVFIPTPRTHKKRRSQPVYPFLEHLNR